MVEQVALAAPCVLIGLPQLGDKNFSHSVVLIVQHDERGSMGLIINRPGEDTLESFCRNLDLSLVEGPLSDRVLIGGPVEPERAFLLHDRSHRGPETEELLEDLRFSFSLETLRLLVADPPKNWRVAIGYAGWGAGQLARELVAGAWMVKEARADILFEWSAETMWERLLGEEQISPLQLGHSFVNS